MPQQTRHVESQCSVCFVSFPGYRGFSNSGLEALLPGFRADYKDSGYQVSGVSGILIMNNRSRAMFVCRLLRHYVSPALGVLNSSLDDNSVQLSCDAKLC